MAIDIEKRKSYLREYNIKNRAKIKIKKKEWLVKNYHKKLEWNRSYRIRNKEKCAISMRRRQLIRKYGITPEKYDQMFLLQNGCCAICGINQILKSRPLCVDHCHKTKVIRGLLCVECNTAIGSLKDSPQLCIKAASYLGGSYVTD